MAMTKAEWLEKLKKYVPSWFFEDEDVNEAYFRGIAAVLEALGEDSDALFDETFISSASTLTLDAYGEERSIPRLGSELDTLYRERLKNVSNQSNCPAIKSAVDNILVAGESTIVEDFDVDIFCDREHFLNRNEILLAPLDNAFSILVERQLHEPYSFVDREYFAGREDFVGRAESDPAVFDLILQEVNRIRLCGTFFRIIELLER